MIERIVFPGRFQPVHNGHIYALKWLVKKTNEIIIVVGSAQKSHSIDNPFTAGERILMLRKAIEHAKLPVERFYYVPIPDIEYNSLWVSYLETLVPPFNAVASRNPLVKRLFIEKGYEIIEPPAYKRRVLSGIKIRKMMLEGGKWEKHVPKPVASIIKEIDGVNRLQQVSGSDEVI